MLKHKTKYSHVFTWNIENFKFWFSKEGEGLRSPLFITDSIDETAWCLMLVHRRNLNSTEDNVSCWLHRTKDDSRIERVCCEFKIEIIGENGEPVVSKKSKKVFKRDSYHGWRDYSKISELQNKAIHSHDTLIIQCYMDGDSIPINRTISKDIARTRICVDRYSFNWLLLRLNGNLEGMVFQCPAKSYFEINAQLLDEDFVIHITRLAKRIPLQKAICTIHLLNRNHSEEIGITASHLFQPNSPVWEFPCFDKELLSSGNFDLMRKKSCNLKFVFSISNGLIEHEIDRQLVFAEAVPIEDTLSPLQDDLRKLLESQKCADLKVQVQDETFLVHKNILSARSPVFSAMFANSMLESETGILDIPDVDKITLRAFLTFIYTGTVDINSKIVLKLLMAAEKYQVISLKDKCCNFLAENLTHENVCEALLFADMVGQEQLKKSAINYVQVNAAKILLSDKWKLLIEKDIKLATDIICKISAGLGIACLKLHT